MPLAATRPRGRLAAEWRFFPPFLSFSFSFFLVLFSRSHSRSFTLILGPSLWFLVLHSRSKLPMEISVIDLTKDSVRICRRCQKKWADDSSAGHGLWQKVETKATRETVMICGPCAVHYSSKKSRGEYRDPLEA
jgi:hypothetical protein